MTFGDAWMRGMAEICPYTKKIHVRKMAEKGTTAENGAAEEELTGWRKR